MPFLVELVSELSVYVRIHIYRLYINRTPVGLYLLMDDSGSERQVAPLTIIRFLIDIPTTMNLQLCPSNNPPG